MFALLYVPLSIAFSVSLFFTGDLLSSVMSLLGIPLIMIPEALEKLLNIKKSYRINLIYFITLALCYSGDAVFHVGRWIPAYNAVCHGLLAILFVIIGIAVSEWCYPVLRSRDRFGTACILAAFFSVAAGVLCTLIEIVFVNFFAPEPLSNMYIAANLAVVLAFSAVFAFVLYKFADSRATAFFKNGIDVLLLRNGKLTRPRPSTVKITSVEEME